MNLNRLRVFDTVARLQSFSRASKGLYLTQPGVSKHILLN
jgi:DNA-binding transcriptional LysR family regulator